MVQGKIDIEERLLTEVQSPGSLHLSAELHAYIIRAIRSRFMLNPLPGISCQGTCPCQSKSSSVIPIILRHVYWQDVLGNLQALPTDAKPIKSWSDLDEALYNVTEGIRKVVMQLTAPPTFVSPSVPGEMQQEIATPSVRTPTVQQAGNVSPSLPPLAVEKLAPLRTLRGHTAAVFSVALSADGQTLSEIGRAHV